jgi:phenylacetate-CoA ligase
MPFIRYDQGDLAVFKSADGLNGKSSRRLTRIIGREDDYATLPDGTRRPFHDFYEVMDKYEDIVQFRIVQRTRGLFTILIVADTSYLLSIREDLLHRLQEKFPPTVNFEITQVEQITPDTSGKIRMLVSEVD